MEQEQEQAEDRSHEPFEPAPVDRFGELRDAGFLVAVEPGLFLRPSEQAGLCGQRLARRDGRGPKRIIALITAARTAAKFSRHPSLRRKRGQPIFVGESKPAGIGCEAFGSSLVEILPIDAVIGFAAEHADRPGVVLPG